MNPRKRQTLLQRVFEHPVPRDLRLRDVLALCADLGAVVTQKRQGVAVIYRGRQVNTHYPHGKDMDKGQVAAIRDLLRDGGIEP